MAGNGVDTRKEQIYQAAGALFSERGYRATSVRDIARELDLQGGSLYAHIASKEDVLWQIILRAAEAFQAEVAPLVGSDAAASERLRRMIQAHVCVVVSQLAFATVFFQDWQHLSEPRRSEMLEMRDDYEALFRRVIAEGAERGEFAPCEPKLAAMFLLTALNGIAQWFRPDGERTAGEIADTYTELILNGLKGAAA